MTARRIDQIWLFGGLALTVLLVAGGWFLMIKPKYADASDVRGQVEDTTAQVATLRKKLADLKADNAKIDTYHDRRDELMKALPTGNKIPADDIPAFLTRLQVMGMKLEIDVDAYSATGRDKSEVVSTVDELPITLNAGGPISEISKFMSQLQNTQPRAVLIQGASLKFDGDNATLTLTLSAFRNPGNTSTAVTTN
jgi:Tfp pilus assembly protein PilO